MDNAEITKHSNVRLVETDYADVTNVTTDANIPIEWTLHRRFYHFVLLQVMQLMQTLQIQVEIDEFTCLPTNYRKSTSTKLTQLFNNSWHHCQHCIHVLVSIVFAQCQTETTVR